MPGTVALHGGKRAPTPILALQSPLLSLSKSEPISIKCKCVQIARRGKIFRRGF
jgi:hypothetical protein